MHLYSAAPARYHAVWLQLSRHPHISGVGQPKSGFATTESDTWISTVKMQRDTRYNGVKQKGTCVIDRSVVNKDRRQCVYKGLDTYGCEDVLQKR
jgi:hypothetical protein